MICQCHLLGEETETTVELCKASDTVEDSDSDYISGPEDRERPVAL